MPWISGGLSLIGGLMSSNATRDAAQTSADAQLESARLAAEAQKFRPVGVTTRFGSSNFQFDPNGYLRIRINKKSYPAHRLAWLIVTGDFHVDELDHINGYKLDNRLSNLRPATREQNGRNIHVDKCPRSGYRGVYWNRCNKQWMAMISISGKNKYLGLFSNKEEAWAVRLAAEKEIYGEFARAA